jgi:predicted RNA-binding protein YlqC (UPF0109 family)
MENDQAFVELVVKQIVDVPEKVTTERTVDERGVLITLTVDASDMGKLIGKEGRTAKAIRTLLRVIGAKNDARVNLKIAEPEGGTGGRPRPERDDTVSAERSNDTEELMESPTDDEPATPQANPPAAPPSKPEELGTQLI